MMAPIGGFLAFIPFVWLTFSTAYAKWQGEDA